MSELNNICLRIEGEPELEVASLKNTTKIALEKSNKGTVLDLESDNKFHQIKPLLTPNPTTPSYTRREQTKWSRIKVGHKNITHVHLIKKKNRDPRTNSTTYN